LLRQHNAGQYSCGDDYNKQSDEPGHLSQEIIPGRRGQQVKLLSILLSLRVSFTHLTKEQP